MALSRMKMLLAGLLLRSRISDSSRATKRIPGIAYGNY